MKLHIASKQKTFDVEITEDATVTDLMNLIATYGFEVKNMRLSFNDSPLLGETRLSNANIHDGSTVQMRAMKTQFNQPVGNSTTMIPTVPPVSPNNPPISAPLKNTSNESVEDPDVRRKIDKLISMGFPEDQARVALRMAKGVYQVAAAFLPLSEEEMKINALPAQPQTYEMPGNNNLPYANNNSRSAIPSSTSSGNSRMGGRSTSLDVAKNPKDEAFYDKMLNFVSSQPKAKILSMILGEVYPQIKSQLAANSNGLQDIIDRIMSFRAKTPKLTLQQKEMVKQFTSAGMEKRLIIPILVETNWDMQKTIEHLKNMSSGKDKTLSSQVMGDPNLPMNKNMGGMSANLGENPERPALPSLPDPAASQASGLDLNSASAFGSLPRPRMGFGPSRPRLGADAN